MHVRIDEGAGLMAGTLASARVPQCVDMNDGGGGGGSLKRPTRAVAAAAAAAWCA